MAGLKKLARKPLGEVNGELGYLLRIKGCK